MFTTRAMTIAVIGLVTCALASCDEQSGNEGALEQSTKAVPALVAESDNGTGPSACGEPSLEFPTESSAAASTTQSTSGATRPAEFTIVRAYYATDRTRDTSQTSSNSIPRGDAYGNGRGSLRYGETLVSIPKDHRLGELEKPSLFRLDFFEDPAKHVVHLSSQEMSAGRFYRAMLKETKRSSRRQALVFFHGYNVSFSDAARRTAQLKYDLQFAGPAVFFSWPSRANPALYTTDEQTIEWSEADVLRFLGDFLRCSGAEEVFVLAHSMGNRAMTRALATVAKNSPAQGARVKEIILAAPDLDGDVFRRDIAPALANIGPVTLYASGDDEALAMSRKVHGAGRAGDAGRWILVTEGVETIDATGLNAGFVGHSYYGDNRSALSDLYYIIHERKRANQRFGLEEKKAEKGIYWAIRK